MSQYASDVGAYLDMLGLDDSPVEDADHDGKSNFSEWIFASDPANAAEVTAHGVVAILQCVSISALGKVKLTSPGGTPVEGQTAAFRIKQQQWFVDGKPVHQQAEAGNPAGK